MIADCGSKDSACARPVRFRVTIGRRTVVYVCGRHLASVCSASDSTMFSVDRLDREGALA